MIDEENEESKISTFRRILEENKPNEEPKEVITEEDVCNAFEITENLEELQSRFLFLIKILEGRRSHLFTRSLYPRILKLVDIMLEKEILDNSEIYAIINCFLTLVTEIPSACSFLITTPFYQFLLNLPIGLYLKPVYNIIISDAPEEETIRDKLNHTNYSSHVLEYAKSINYFGRIHEVLINNLPFSNEYEQAAKLATAFALYDEGFDLCLPIIQTEVQSLLTLPEDTDPYDVCRLISKIGTFLRNPKMSEFVFSNSDLLRFLTTHHEDNNIACECVRFLSNAMYNREVPQPVIETVVEALQPYFESDAEDLVRFAADAIGDAITTSNGLAQFCLESGIANKLLEVFDCDGNIGTKAAAFRAASAVVIGSPWEGKLAMIERGFLDNALDRFEELWCIGSMTRYCLIDAVDAIFVDAEDNGAEEIVDAIENSDLMERCLGFYGDVPDLTAFTENSWQIAAIGLACRSRDSSELRRY